MLEDRQRRTLSSAREQLTRFPIPGDFEVSVAELAAARGFTVSHFIRLFRAVFGETPHQMRIRHRVRWTRQQLGLTDRSVTDLCMDAGGSSLGSFSAGFTRRVGRSPVAFRAHLRRAEPDSEARRRRLVPGCFEVMGLAATTSDPAP